MCTPAVPLPLSTLLSQALVAFTIETDQIFELEFPHVTTEDRKAGRGGRGPWLISFPFWSNCLQYVARGGSSVGEVLERGFLAGNFLLGTNPGMVRWGYLTLAAGRSASKRPNRAWTAAPTSDGRLAQAIWEPLPPIVERRWSQRWPYVPRLREQLVAIVSAAGRDLPDHLPINAGHDAWVDLDVRAPIANGGNDLAALLAKALLLFTLEVEATSSVPLVHSANVLRALRDGPVSKKDFPVATGIAKETLAVMTGLLQKQELLALAPGNVWSLTEAGRTADREAEMSVSAVEAQWPTELRALLELLVGDGTVDGSALAEAVQPPEGTWRHRRPRPKTLPHHPVVSHRGGYPDGS
jgi:hypothetical protein